MSNPSPLLAAFLSLLFPGLGQIYARQTRRGVLWALPTLVVIVLGLFVVLGGSRSLANFLTASNALALVLFDLAFLVYHAAAMVDAYLVAQHARPVAVRAVKSSAGKARAGAIGLAALIAVAIVIHGLPAMYGWSYYLFASSYTGDSDVIPLATFAPETIAPQPSVALTPSPATTDPSSAPTADGSSVASDAPATASTAATQNVPDSGAPSSPGASVAPRACAVAPNLANWAPGADGRLNIMLVGSDSRSDEGVSDASLRTDSIMLLSVDIADCKAALFSFPRNMTNAPVDSVSRYPDWLYIPTEDGHDYGGYLFGLWRDAATSPAQYPGSDGIGADCQTQFECQRGWRALTYAIQQMSGVNVDGVIAVNLKGFVDIVANLPGGGVWLDVPEALQDDAYYNSQQQLYPINFKTGCQFLGPEDTLAYSRSRHQDSDYQRARRQQFVLQSVRKQLDPLGLLPHIPGLLQAAQANLFMTFSSDDFPYLAQVASRVDAERLYQYDFAPAHLVPLGSMAGLQAKVQNIFDEPEPEPGPKQQLDPCPPS